MDYQKSKKVFCGNVQIGGGAPVSIQSMTNKDTRDVKATTEQIHKLTEAGCQIVRLAVLDMEAAEAFGRIKKSVSVPLVADIHFDYRLAVEAIKQGADKVRINPGNIGSRDRITAVVTAARERNIPIRIGVNSGSLEKELVEKHGGVTAEAMVESALKNMKILQDMDFEDIVISLKSSDIPMNHKAHKLLKTASDCPIHIGLTESGSGEEGRLKSAVALGALLLEGIGDTMRISLTGDPVKEVLLAKEILRSLNLRDEGINVISCPTCGRTRVDLEAIVQEVKEALKPIAGGREREGKQKLTIAIMGCAVNGPGEAQNADFGVACGEGKGLIFEKGQIIKTVEEKHIAAELIAMAQKF